MSRDDVLRRLAPYLDDDELELLERRLAGDPNTESVAWLEELVDAAVALPIVDVPPLLARSLRRQIRGPVPKIEHRAVLRTESRTGDLVGVRGHDGDDGWTWSFTVEVADVLVDVWPRTDHRFDLDVQVIPNDGDPVAFRADLSGPEPRTASADELGRASIDAVLPGEYALRLDDGESVILAEFSLEETR